MHAYAVIGANFGDEGKGLMTDYLVRQSKDPKKCLVVRYNGGAQAGHTVVDSETGNRHVFGHLGAGTFAGAATYLASPFVINFFALLKEFEQLESMGVDPAHIPVIINPECHITTVFDMALNGLRELSRSLDPAKRHGSCGMGINETVTRGVSGFAITAKEFIRLSRSQLHSRLEWIFENYWKKQITDILAFSPKDLQQTKEFNDLIQIMNVSDEATKLTLLKRDIIFNTGKSVLVGDVKDLYYYDTVVFEGAQGLMLDEQLGVFPHVTRSITGLPGVALAAKEVGVTSITPVYVTRAFTTRHGAGDIKHWDKHFIGGVLLKDKTNKFGEWQGNFRYACLDLQETLSFIEQDLTRSKAPSVLFRVSINAPELAITHLDLAEQANMFLFKNSYGEDITVHKGEGNSVTNSMRNQIEMSKLAQTTGLKTKYLSYGETSFNITALMSD